MEDIRKYKAQRVHTHQNPKKFVVATKNGASFGLYVCDCGQWGSEIKF